MSVLYRPRSVYIEKNYVLYLECDPRPAASGKKSGRTFLDKTKFQFRHTPVQMDPYTQTQTRPVICCWGQT